ncbi:MAG: hypothetical protein WDM76_16040 [Limisphaerales bacterium]
MSGLRKKFPKYLAFLGYTRFANYFMIAIFPIQSHYLPWTGNDWAQLPYSPFLLGCFCISD